MGFIKDLGVQTPIPDKHAWLMCEFLANGYMHPQ